MVYIGRTLCRRKGSGETLMGAGEKSRRFMTISPAGLSPGAESGGFSRAR